MSNHAFRRDLKALRHELEELQERLEDLGESGSDAAKHALNEMKGKLETKLRSVFSSHEPEGQGKSFFRAEHEGQRFLRRAEHRGRGAFYEARHEHDKARRGTSGAASLIVFGLGFAVGWLVARR